MEYVQLLKRVDFTIGMQEKQADVIFAVLKNHPEIKRLNHAELYETEIMGCKISRWYLNCRTYDEAEFQALVDELEKQKLHITISIH